MNKLLALRIVLSVVAFASIARANWIDTYRAGEVACFLQDSAARIDRYDLSTRAWLAPVNLPPARGIATAGWVDANGIYIAYGRAVYRYALDGTSEVPLVNAASNVTEIVANISHIFIHPAQNASLTSISKATNTIVETKSFFYTMTGMSVAPDGSVIYGRINDVSPSDVVRVPINVNGTLGSQTDSPHHGAYPSATQTWVFPNGARVVDSSGTVYLSDSLRFTLSFGGRIDDLQFRGEDLPIVLRGGELIAYTNTLLPAGSKTLGFNPKTPRLILSTQEWSVG